MSNFFQSTAIGALGTLLVLAGCSTALPAPDLERALVLATRIETAEVRAGQSFMVTFTVRNVSTAPIETCIDGDGVSVRVRSTDGSYMFPVTSFGIHLHAMCPDETRLEPGEEKTYRQSVFTLVNFPGDRAIVEGTLQLKQHPRFRTGPGETYFSLKSLAEVQVKAFTAE